MLELPDVAELVRDQVVVEDRVLQEDQVPRGVAAEAAEPGHAEDPGHDEDPDPAQVDRARVEAEPIEARLRSPERVALARQPRDERGGAYT
jgi:hypothetical protein